MIDKNITINKLDDLHREIIRIEFSTSFKKETVETAMRAREALEQLIHQVEDHESEEIS